MGPQVIEVTPRGFEVHIVSGRPVEEVTDLHPLHELQAGLVLGESPERAFHVAVRELRIHRARRRLVHIEERAGGRFPKGAVDEVEIWNYTMNPVEVATMYTDLIGGWICVTPAAFDTTGPDGMPDCKVDLYEMAQIAEVWLECGRIPASNCD